MEVDIPIEIKPGQMRCPRCFSRDVVESQRQGVLDSLMHRLGREPLHCRFCGKRFYHDPRKAATTEAKADPRA